MTKSVAVIGDVHGDAVRLRQALGHPSLRERTIVLVGDYVNRGPASREVLEVIVLAEAVLGSRLVALRGNHDEAFLRALEGERIAEFLVMGGDRTVISYLKEPFGDVMEELAAVVPIDHKAFLRTLRDSWTDGEILVMHSLDQLEEAGVQLSSASALTCVVGHHIQHDGQASTWENVHLIDTGCGSRPEGPLSVYLYPEREVLTF